MRLTLTIELEVGDSSLKDINEFLTEEFSEFWAPHDEEEPLSIDNPDAKEIKVVDENFNTIFYKHY